MIIKKLKIKNVELDNNIIMAPLAGYTDVGFRDLVASYGAGATTTEMVSAKGIVYDSKKTSELLYTTENEKVKIAQIFGGEPNFIYLALKNELFNKFDIIDINMGCPVSKIVKNNEGSALLKDSGLAYEIVQAAVSSTDKPITVKIRRGYALGDDVSLNFSKVIEKAGASAITIHGRYKEQLYAGKSDRECIKIVKENLSIPIIANGDIFSKNDCCDVMNETQADGVMIARGALGNPGIFLDILGKDRYLSKKQEIMKYISTLEKFYHSELIYRMIKTQLSFFFRGEINSNKKRVAIVNSKSLDEIKNCIEIFLD